MDFLTIFTFLIILSAAFSYFNERVIKLPSTIGVVTISVIVSLLILIVGKSNNQIASTITTLSLNIDFSKVLLDLMLGFLLFASALHFDYEKLKEQRLPVLLLSTLGVLVSAGVFGFLLYLVTQLLHINMPLMYCFLFGSLISPTDPIVVSAIIKRSKVPARLQTVLSGESLFNDGLGLILFVILLDVTNLSTENFTLFEILTLFAQEVVFGIGLGLIFGYLGHRMMTSIKDFQTIFLISISIVLGIALVANHLHASVPLAAVSAGLIIGNKSQDKNKPANQFLSRIWDLVDEVLNTILFVMIGLQLVVMPFLDNAWLTGFLSIIIILIARFASVSLPAFFLLKTVRFNILAILTWAGLRGGISVALALMLPPSPYRDIILSSCYFIVIFSIIVQGLTLNRVVKAFVGTSKQ